MKKQTIKLNEENINSEHWNNKIDMLLRTLQYLKDHLENGLFVVNGFLGGQRMEAINRIGLCCMALNDILNKGGITLTDKSVPVASPYKLNESQLRQMIKESIKKVLCENDFTPHGYMTTSNLGGKEIEISNSNDAVRFRTEDGSISDWFEIEYDEEGNPIVNTPWGTEDLNNYMRFN